MHPQELKMLLLTKYDRLGASSRYRTLQYIPYLEQHGVRCHHVPFFDDTYLQHLYQHGHGRVTDLAKAAFRRIKSLLTSNTYDLVWVEKELIPFFPALFERLMRLKGTRTIVDYDDALFHRYDNHARVLVRLLFGEKISTVMRLADAVVAGNPYLAGYAQDAGARRVYELPTVVDLSKYSNIEKAVDDNFTIGWIGSPSTTKHLETIAPVLREISLRHNVHVHLIGAAATHSLSERAEVLPWSEASEVTDIQQLDVGIMPLPDAPWERGKCGFKLIQYMACGIPVIASPVGVNRAIVEHGVNGFLAETAEEWLEAINILTTSPELRLKMGRAGRKKVEEEYSLQVAAPRLLKIIQDTVSICHLK